MRPDPWPSSATERRLAVEACQRVLMLGIGVVIVEVFVDVNDVVYIWKEVWS